MSEESMLSALHARMLTRTSGMTFLSHGVEPLWSSNFTPYI